VKRLCVFCGSSTGHDPVYAAVAVQLGQALAKRRIGLVYGGGGVGLMGVVANAVLAAGGEVVGVIPQPLLDREHGHGALTDLRVVGSMHERKALMVELSDGFVALPGGIGTLEELFEVWTWAQLGMHEKPCGLVDAGGFFTPLVGFLDQVVATGFLSATSRAMLTVAASPEELLARFDAYRAPDVPKWLDTPAQA
jgi:uncharacterized protein (TIGR00730 family)